MGLLAILSGISTIVSLLFVFFDVDKIHITLNKFLLLLSIVCLVIFSVAYISNKMDSGNLNNEEKGSSNSEEALKANTSERVGSSAEPVDESRETDSEKGILKIDSIVSNTYNAVAIEDVPFEIQSNEIIEFSGEVSSDGQSNDYEYIPPLSGTYRFEFSNVPNGTDLRLKIYNSGWEEMNSGYDLDTGDGLTENLTAGDKRKKQLILPTLQQFLTASSIRIKKMIICM